MGLNALRGGGSIVSILLFFFRDVTGVQRTLAHTVIYFKSITKRYFVTILNPV